ncbi:hypothetical protein BV25DRAFT_1840955 [Artomyces pyxidatus]|uniref:Uncharacterized protein n=1 Tax=Artomyces pyxidatus TaxID=48021 RepID=A0ACB8SRM9_9AGAM|nr:hypothetical protein BV25DRAFT_1840955 [Artomyces pyxidatus]
MPRPASISFPENVNKHGLAYDGFQAVGFSTNASRNRERGATPKAFDLVPVESRTAYGECDWIQTALLSDIVDKVSKGKETSGAQGAGSGGCWMLAGPRRGHVHATRRSRLVPPGTARGASVCQFIITTSPLSSHSAHVGHHGIGSEWNTELRFLNAEHETGLSWALWLLANDARAQKNLRDEVSKADAEAQRLDYRLFRDLPILDCLKLPQHGEPATHAAVCSHLPNIRPSRWSTQIHVANTSIDVRGPDAEAFRPECWLALPAAYNPRGCIGKTMSISEMKFAPTHAGLVATPIAATTMSARFDTLADLRTKRSFLVCAAEPEDNIPLLVTPVRRGVWFEGCCARACIGALAVHMGSKPYSACISARPYFHAVSLHDVRASSYIHNSFATSADLRSPIASTHPDVPRIFRRGYLQAMVIYEALTRNAPLGIVPHPS